MRADARNVSKQTREALVRRISSTVGLTDEERIQINSVSSESRAKGSLIAEDGDFKRSCFLISGWAIRQAFLSDGKRQISGFIVPGDPLGPFSCLGEVVSSGIVAITPVEVWDLGRANSAQAALPVVERFDMVMAREHLRFDRNQMIRLGCHSALQRMAHLLLELDERLAAVGLVSQGMFDFPLTQEMLGDALGLSVVHVNRTMKQLREAGLLQQRDNFLQILNQKRLEDLSEYAAPP